MIELPLTRSEISKENPKLLIIYAPPKAGKTTLMSTLPNNLILDLEKGTDYVQALRVRIIGWAAPINESDDAKEARHNEKLYYIDEVGQSIIRSGRPYEFLTVDTTTALEDMIMPQAVAKYKATQMGANYQGTDVRDLPRGAGYYYLRLAFKEAIDKLKKLAPHIILIAHLKDTMIEKAGKEVSAKDIDLTGKLKQIACADADAIGYLHRGPNHELLINFKSSDEVLCGARCNHLKGREITIAEYNPETNDLDNINWALIYPENFTNNE